ncbi:MAG: sulfotransferase [Caulobacterales bacterium]|nr:sulfotransferase [Caulobacterales bacterium]
MAGPEAASAIAEGRAAEKAGRLADALASYKRALAAAPADAEARRACSGLLARIGAEHQAAGRLQQAADAFDSALMLDDRNLGHALQLARLLMALGNPPAARHVLAHAERLAPNERAVASLQADVARMLGDWPELERVAVKLAEMTKSDPAAWRAVANARVQQGRYGPALEAFEKAIHKSPSAEDLVELARLALQALDFSRAEKAITEAEEIAPRSPAVLATKALLLTYQGKTQQAEEYCLRCLEIDPGFIQAYPQLSALRKGRLTPSEEEPLKVLVRNESASFAARATAGFVLAHSLDARGEVDLAFSEYERANSLSASRARAEGLVFDADGADAWTDHIIKTFRGAQARRAFAAPTPIFIVGLPRSGSTLIESVLEAHSKVASAGEAPMLPPMFNAWLKARGIDNDGVLTEEERGRFVETYLAGAPTDAAYFTDKNLLNIEAVGFAAQLFPSARFVNIRRNPLECGLAIYRQDFLKFWTFTTDLKSIGRRYTQYARLVAHWERHYPERFMTVQYETFTDNFEAEARRLVAFCGLEWEDACRDFQKAERVAATISAAQVREPVRRATARAEAYSKYLGPLREALAAGGVDLSTGALKGQG